MNSSTPHLDSLRFVIYDCASKHSQRFYLFSIACVSAFLNVISDHEAYVSFPQGITNEKGHNWRLKRALYGTVRDPRLWYKTLENLLHKLGFLRLVADTCLYYRKLNRIVELIFFHVGDLILCTTPEKAKAFINSVKNKFGIHDFGFSIKVLGI